MNLMDFVFIFIILSCPMLTVVSEISWESCSSKTDDILLLNLQVNPDPIVAPGLVLIEILIQTNQTITSPIKVKLSVKKKIFIGYVPVPCVSTFSCTYDDLCKNYNCPIGPGEHRLNFPITIDSSSSILYGNYQIEIRIETNTGQKTCIKINNVNIRK